MKSTAMEQDANSTPKSIMLDKQLAFRHLTSFFASLLPRPRFKNCRLVSALVLFASLRLTQAIPPMWNVPLSSQPDSVNPVVSPDGTIFFTVSAFPDGSQMQVYAITPAGGVKWANTFNGLNVNNFIMGGDDGTLFVQADTDLLAIDADGNEKWRFPTGRIYGAYGANDRAGFVYWLTTKSSTATQLQTTLYALDAKGKLRWSTNYTETTIPNVANFPPVAISSSGDVYASLDSLRVFDRAGGEKWHANILPGSHFAFDDASRVYFMGFPTNGTSQSGFLYCYDAAGAKQWQSSVSFFFNTSYLSPLVSSDGLILKAFNDGLNIFDAQGKLIRNGFGGGGGDLRALLDQSNVIDPRGEFNYATSPPNAITDYAPFDFPSLTDGGTWVPLTSPTVSSNGIAYIPATTGGGQKHHAVFAFDTGKAVQNSPWPQVQQNSWFSGQARAQNVLPPEPKLTIEQAVAIETPTVSGVSYQTQQSLDLSNWDNVGALFVGNGRTITNFFIPSSQVLFYQTKVVP